MTRYWRVAARKAEGFPTRSACFAAPGDPASVLRVAAPCGGGTVAKAVSRGGVGG